MTILHAHVYLSQRELIDKLSLLSISYVDENEIEYRFDATKHSGKQCKHNLRFEIALLVL